MIPDHVTSVPPDLLMRLSAIVTAMPGMSVNRIMVCPAARKRAELVLVNIKAGCINMDCQALDLDEHKGSLHVAARE